MEEYIMEPLIKVEDVSYGNSAWVENIVLKDISLQIEDGEFIAIVGPSGCGKSTLLSLMAGLVEPTEGKIHINDLDLNTSGKSIGYILQKEYLLSWKETKENIVLGLELQDNLINNSDIIIKKMLDNCCMVAFKNSSYIKLSDRMKQRAALIRALLLESDILLLDEPFAALDYQDRFEFSKDVYNLIRQEGKTAVLVTNNLSEAVSVADRIIVLTKKPGMVKSVISVDLKFSEKMPFRAENAPEFKKCLSLLCEAIDKCD